MLNLEIITKLAAPSHEKSCKKVNKFKNVSRYFKIKMEILLEFKI